MQWEFLGRLSKGFYKFVKTTHYVAKVTFLSTIIYMF